MHGMLSPRRLRICKNTAKTAIDSDSNKIRAIDHFFNEDIIQFDEPELKLNERRRITLISRKIFCNLDILVMDSLKAPSLSSLLSGTDRGSSDSLLGSLNLDLDEVIWLNSRFLINSK